METIPKKLSDKAFQLRFKNQATTDRQATLVQAYALKIIERLGVHSKVFLYWKGRVALNAMLRAMGVGAGDEVILPAYTCVVVPNAIFYTEAKPVYVDVCPDTYCLDLDKLEEALTDRTKVIICQNTYGMSAGVERLVEIARRRNLFTIEDCTHGFGGSYEGRPNGTYCDAAFFSTQWNKPFSTGIGGFAVVNRAEILPRLIALENEKQKPSIMEAGLLAGLIWARRWLLKDWSYWALVAFYRWLSQHSLVLGSSQGGELNDTSMPKGFFKGISTVQAREGLRALTQLDAQLDLRRKNAEIYTEFLKSKSKNHVARAFFKNHSFLKYPLRVTDRPAFQTAAQKARIPLGDWFCSPLHPVEGGLEKWGFTPENFPVATFLAKTVVNLPTDTKDPGKVIIFLEKHLNLIDPNNCCWLFSFGKTFECRVTC